MQTACWPWKYKQLCVVLILLLAACPTLAQSTISGKIVAADTRKPVAFANVFLANTSIGVTSKEDGSFTLSNIPEGQYQLVVSSVGFEAFMRPFKTKELPLQLEVLLKPKVDELKEVVVGSYEKNGWDKWGDVFLEHFIGTSVFAEETELMNKDVLRFRFDPQADMLTVTARDRLVINNKALGYILHYDLEFFEFDIKNREFRFSGYPFFEEMSTTHASLQEKWERRRSDAYHGSLMHFMRSFYNNQLKEQGFEVRRKMVLTEAEKNRVTLLNEEIKRMRKIPGDTGRANPNDNNNSELTGYVNMVMKARVGEMIVPDIQLSMDRISGKGDGQSRELLFTESLEIRYPAKRFPREYGRASVTPSPVTKGTRTWVNTGSIMVGKTVFSDLTLVANNQPVNVYSNGSFDNGLNIVTSYYLSWWEKICNKLPYGYQPLKK
jgi:hypothetical protein